jgi:hypothetical protein
MYENTIITKAIKTSPMTDFLSIYQISVNGQI